MLAGLPARRLQRHRVGPPQSFKQNNPDFPACTPLYGLFHSPNPREGTQQILPKRQVIMTQSEKLRYIYIYLGFIHPAPRGDQADFVHTEKGTKRPMPTSGGSLGEQRFGLLPAPPAARQGRKFAAARRLVCVRASPLHS